MPYHAAEEKETGNPVEAYYVAAEEDATKRGKGPTVCIVGDGNAAHVLIPFLGDTHHTVNLMSLNPSKWESTVRCDWKNMKNEVLRTFVGDINKISDDFADVIPDADIVFLCLPVHQYRNALGKLAPYIDRSKGEVFVGTIYGQAGFNWMVHEIETKHKLTNLVAFSIGLIPWICRAEQYGSHGTCYGGKKVNVAAVHPPDRFDKLNEIFLDDVCHRQLGVGKFVQACSFISLTLSVDNQIIHPSRMYGLWKRYGGKWKTYDEVPFFYREFDDLSADCLRRLDENYSTVRKAIRERFPDRPFEYMLNYLDLERFVYESNAADIKSSFTESETLGQIKTPVMHVTDDVDASKNYYMIDVRCRFFTDDIPYGLLIAKWIAEKLGIGDKVPFIDEIINWVQELRAERFLDEENKIDLAACLRADHTCGIPPSYGITSVEDILD
jgi:hypothetical protein